MLVDLAHTPDATLSEVGGKAHNIVRLHAIDMPVPRAIVIPSSTDISDKGVREHILKHDMFNDPERLYAVRSSGVGEDSVGNSYAGIFDTYLDVSLDDVFGRIADVRKSVSSERSDAYSDQRGVQVLSMSVIVQHMVPAEYAGVAFTTSPIEKDDRIALIEIVPGLGESLVSGKTTPTTIRYNKRTKQFRIEQHGAHKVDQEILAEILQAFMPYVRRIEAEYDYPVDIEWAYANGAIFILQARPITT